MGLAGVSAPAEAMVHKRWFRNPSTRLITHLQPCPNDIILFMVAEVMHYEGIMLICR